jgi:hypothetical protein
VLKKHQEEGDGAEAIKRRVEDTIFWHCVFGVARNGHAGGHQQNPFFREILVGISILLSCDDSMYAPIGELLELDWPSHCGSSGPLSHLSHSSQEVELGSQRVPGGVSPGATMHRSFARWLRESAMRRTLLRTLIIMEPETIMPSLSQPSIA